MQLKINAYDTVETGEYNGKWQIRVGYINKNGEFKPYFKSVTNKDGSTRSVPMSLTFDDYKTRIEFLNVCAENIGEDNMYAFLAHQADLHGYELVKKPKQSDVPF